MNVFKKHRPEEEENILKASVIKPEAAKLHNHSPAPPPPRTPPAGTRDSKGVFSAPTQPVRSSAMPTATSRTSPSRTLVVGRGITIQGSIQDAERLVVEGTVEANMVTAREFIVAAGGIFRGVAEVDNTELAGTIDGTLSARNSLNIQATGRLIGKAECRRLQVEDGGQIIGQLEVITDPEPATHSVHSIHHHVVRKPSEESQAIKSRQKTETE